MNKELDLETISPSDRLTLDDFAALLYLISEERCALGYGQPYPDMTEVVGNRVCVASLYEGKDYAAPVLYAYSKSELNEAWKDAVVSWKYNVKDTEENREYKTFGDCLLSEFRPRES